MSSFDIVMVPCPRCGDVNEFQSKGGDCMMNRYDLADAPSDVMSDVNRHAPTTCYNCGTVYRVELVVVGTPIHVEQSEEV